MQLRKMPMVMRFAIICPYIPRERCELVKLEKRPGARSTWPTGRPGRPVELQKMDIATPELPSGDSSYSCNSRIILTSVQGKDRPLQSKILTNNLFWLVVLKCFKHFCVVHPSKDDYPIICFHIFGRQGPPQPLMLIYDIAKVYHSLIRIIIIFPMNKRYEFELS